MKVFDFRCCDCRTDHEELVDNDARYGEKGEACPMCGGETRAIPVPPKPRVATAAPGFDRGSGRERQGGDLDTRSIADRKDTEATWRDKRRKMWRDRDRARDLGHRDKLTIRSR